MIELFFHLIHTLHFKINLVVQILQILLYGDIIVIVYVQIGAVVHFSLFLNIVGIRNFWSWALVRSFSWVRSSSRHAVFL
jgi:hypothetical protein